MSDPDRASYDAIIIGAGVIGSAIAFELALNVTILKVR